MTPPQRAVEACALWLPAGWAVSWSGTARRLEAVCPDPTSGVIIVADDPATLIERVERYRLAKPPTFALTAPEAT